MHPPKIIQLMCSFTLLVSVSLPVRADEPGVFGPLIFDNWSPDPTVKPTPQLESTSEGEHVAQNGMPSEAGILSIEDGALESDTIPGAELLPPLEVELHHHGGSYFYEPLDVNSELYEPHDAHVTRLRLPEDWVGPQPLSLPEDYLGSHFIDWQPQLSWFGCPGYQWEPRFVAYGSYELFGAFYEENGVRRDGIGHQLLLELDLALTGTERVHVQFRPLGEQNTGGSFWQLSSPSEYIDNSTGVPQRWWIEGELQSIIGRLLNDPTLQFDVNFTAGKFPFALHNALLMNDEITGIVLGKNTLTSTPLSNINTQLFYAFDEVDAYSNQSTDIAGVHFTGDYRHAFLELSYIHAFVAENANLDTNYFALSGTQFFGPLSLAGRAMFKQGDEGGAGDGQLYVMESNFTRTPSDWWEEHTGVGLTVSYLNLFHATSGWQPIAGGNFNRLTNLFTLNPLLQIAAGRPPSDTSGAVFGVQLFRHHEDESLIPEIAIEDTQGDTVGGVSLRYQRKLTPRT
ncbi:MAG: hypothetical protein KDA52_04845, partial [Planctomycetaceae bacterium]|nr:hypothetical protein [Planctomycetaceae bacterium]